MMSAGMVTTFEDPTVRIIGMKICFVFGCAIRSGKMYIFIYLSKKHRITIKWYKIKRKRGSKTRISFYCPWNTATAKNIRLSKNTMTRIVPVKSNFSLTFSIPSLEFMVAL